MGHWQLRTSQSGTGVRPNRQAAYSLLELVIVLAILASVAAIAWPRMHPRLRRSSQREAALQLKSHLVEARERAVRAGQEIEVRVYPGTGRYLLQPVVSTIDPATGDSGPGFDTSGRDAGLPYTFDEPGGDQQEWSARRELPDGVIFPHVDTRVGGPPSSVRLVDATAASGTTEFATPLRPDPVVMASFYADGRATEVEIKLLRPETSETIAVRLRGLTGSVAIGSVERPALGFEPEETLPVSAALSQSESLP